MSEKEHDPQRRADEKFVRDAAAIFSRTPFVPADAAIIAEIYTWGFLEDGRTFALTCSTSNGDTLIVQATPGEPLSIALVQDPRAQ